MSSVFSLHTLSPFQRPVRVKLSLEVGTQEAVEQEMIPTAAPLNRLIIILDLQYACDNDNIKKGKGWTRKLNFEVHATLPGQLQDEQSIHMDTHDLIQVLL